MTDVFFKIVELANRNLHITAISFLRGSRTYQKPDLPFRQTPTRDGYFSMPEYFL